LDAPLEGFIVVADELHIDTERDISHKSNVGCMVSGLVLCMMNSCDVICRQQFRRLRRGIVGDIFWSALSKP
jgi:hypothetical protein